jgi:hypothetical protein
MIAYLKKYFQPGSYEEGYSLAISAGKEVWCSTELTFRRAECHGLTLPSPPFPFLLKGARLTHSHDRQYNFALQSLTLWQEIVHDMFRLWCLAEQDLLSEKEPYKLEDTGQGKQRLQACPRTFKAMQEILYHTQKEVEVSFIFRASTFL